LEQAQVFLIRAFETEVIPRDGARLLSLSESFQLILKAIIGDNDHQLATPHLLQAPAGFSFSVFDQVSKSTEKKCFRQFQRASSGFGIGHSRFDHRGRIKKRSIDIQKSFHLVLCVRQA